jgi:phage shock protein C
VVRVKRLYKSDTDRKVAGVCAGVAEYYDVDPTLIRAGFLFVTIISGIIPGLIAYVLVAWIMPSKAEAKNG